MSEYRKGPRQEHLTAICSTYGISTHSFPVNWHRKVFKLESRFPTMKTVHASRFLKGRRGSWHCWEKHLWRKSCIIGYILLDLSIKSDLVIWCWYFKGVCLSALPEKCTDFCLRTKEYVMTHLFFLLVTLFDKQWWCVVTHVISIMIWVKLMDELNHTKWDFNTFFPLCMAMDWNHITVVESVLTNTWRGNGTLQFSSTRWWRLRVQIMWWRSVIVFAYHWKVEWWVGILQTIRCQQIFCRCLQNL
jgi:hypothetical protein